MQSRLGILFAVVLVALTRVAGTAQESDPDARTLLQAAVKAMGGENLNSIEYSGTTGYVAAVGQNFSPAHDWPANQLKSYTRTIDYAGRSSKEDLTLTPGTGQGGPTGGGH
ncbi:MAG: hypothetical protein HY824_06420, partial [Acidobacteria bacterium]|nr:hypothetical protein [Acidobacteriota bacterium]